MPSSLSVTAAFCRLSPVVKRKLWMTQRQDETRILRVPMLHREAAANDEIEKIVGVTNLRQQKSVSVLQKIRISV